MKPNSRARVGSDNEWGDARRACIYGRNCGRDAVFGMSWGFGFCEEHLPYAVDAARGLRDSEMLVDAMLARPYSDDGEPLPEPSPPVGVGEVCEETALEKLKTLLPPSDLQIKMEVDSMLAGLVMSSTMDRQQKQQAKQSRINIARGQYELFAPAHPHRKACVEGHSWESNRKILDAINHGCKACGIEYAYRQILQGAA